MSTAGLIILSGKTQWRERFDAARRTGSIPDACRLLLTFQRAGLAPAVCVLGEPDAALERELGRLGAVLLHNPDGAAEMLDNVRLGLAALPKDCKRVLITPVDTPLVRAETVRRLAECPAGWAVPEYRGQAGHPVLVGAARFGDILAHRGPGGLRAALGRNGETPHRVEVDDPGVVLDAARAELDDTLARQHDLWRLRPEVRVCLCREQVFWGPGTRRLLTLIDALGSVREASARMGMSYSKAWKMLRELEAQLGFAAVARRQGGRHGGEASLTPRGRRVLARFAAYERACRTACDALFHQHFPEPNTLE